MQRTIENNILRLTPAENDIMELVSRGWDNDAIARHLFITNQVVRNYINSIISKLSCVYDFNGKDKRAYLCVIWREWNSK